MRWNTSTPTAKKVDKVVGTALAVVLAPVWIPAFAILGGVLGLVWCIDKVHVWLGGPTPAWQSWFAWRPVRVSCDDWAWMERIERCRPYPLGNTLYRLPRAAG